LKALRMNCAARAAPSRQCKGDLNCPVPQNSLIINEPPRSLSAPQNSGRLHETQGSIVAMVGEGAGRLHCRALTLPRSRLTERGMRRQSHPHDPPQGHARFQKTMAKKCLDNGQYVERLATCLGRSSTVSIGTFILQVGFSGAGLGELTAGGHVGSRSAVRLTPRGCGGFFFANRECEDAAYSAAQHMVILADGEC
jgi:hypothetical protein